MNAADKEILEDFKRARHKTIDLLKAVPDAMLRKKAKRESGKLAALFDHIAMVVDGWMFRCMQDGGKAPNWNETKPLPSKQALLRALKSSERRLLKFFSAKDGAAMNKKFSGEWRGEKYSFVGRNRVLYLTHHEVHHRGKIVLALRQWGFADVPFLPFE